MNSSSTSAIPPYRQQMHRLQQCLSSLHFLSRARLPEIESLMALIRQRHFKKDELVFKQGDAGDSFYMVASGRFAYCVRRGFSSQKVASLAEGEYFGEAALISDAPRAATVIAEEDSEAFILHKDDFKKIFLSNHEIAADLKLHMASRRMARH